VYRKYGAHFTQAVFSNSSHEPEFSGRTRMAMTEVMKARHTYWRTTSMDIIATDPIMAPDEAAYNYLTRTSGGGFVESARSENLNIETVTSNPLLPTDRKWAIRFDAGGTVTIILGMKDYGRGWFSSYFAGIAAARLGIPFRQFRLYYSATLPAVLQTPVPSPSEFDRCQIGPIANAVADVVEGMCDQVIEKGRSAFATLAGVGTPNVDFDRQTGHFFVLERARSGSIFEIAEATRGGSSVMREAGRKLAEASAPGR
jgi:hypothetical protein